ncbi:hypothetical protein Poly51_02210 [Rubripirellula tenax]|uniref:Uncharacterized protein n=1 Tax=Rubripirellula tenax TaxID=2528015 RepID=A0A5C6FEX3_9BACT|nr:hypothetical protein Poly51_02210 [Rubripirellula tenax]
MRFTRSDGGSVFLLYKNAVLRRPVIADVTRLNRELIEATLWRSFDFCNRTWQIQ